ncbi:uncharacterized protein MELLADRAFT_71273 [Melampsora larici-populina 98AG31]|uniref:Uncharacterized protein n=1 Tax=Melampsora larici-populina (strain 98AG31 / pathotype 3-4-7) TaxID=747676 RepID=F4REC1_MELLP|nr:uncharacterized protein MELLADRAFT_71273 [Melampsora larici-populina 98AG31]EGG09063.1 hypothetical protein MELLADRAFT_71273 [Melampsora larici-populina 98AG31]
MLSIVFEEFTLAGWHDHGTSEVISGTKPLFLLVASWAYLWSFVCLLVSIRLKPIAGNPTALPAVVSWTLNGLFLVILLWPFAPVFWSFYMVSVEHVYILKILEPITKALLQSAHTYSKRTYTPAKIIVLLLPAEKALARIAIVSIHVRRGLTCYLVSCVLLCLAYPPFLFFTLKTMILPSHLEKSLKLQRNAVPVFQISILTFLVSACNIPLLYWMLNFPGDSFVTDSTWWVGMELGLTIPYTIVANINLWVSYRAANRQSPTKEPRDRPINLGNLLSQSLSVSQNFKSTSFNATEKV